MINLVYRFQRDIMKMPGIRFLLLLIITGMFFTSCKVIRPFESPELPTDSLFRNHYAGDTNNIAKIRWDNFFTDTLLKGLIATGIENNPEIRMAFTRLQQAESYYLQSRAAYLPTIDANASGAVMRLSEAQGFGIRTNASQYELGISTSWELDIWGKLRSARNANLASLLQSQAARDAVQTGLIASIANYYYILLALDQQLEITKETVKNWDITVQTMRALKEAARVTEAAVVQSEAQLYATEITIPDLIQNIRETENALSILLGQAPDSIVRSSIRVQPVPQIMSAGIPAQLLANRPDVREAELNFRYFFEMTNVARTFFYPALSITGSAGLSSLSLSELISPASFAARIGGGIVQPIFNRRMNKTRLEVAQAQQEEARINFTNTLLNAGREVSDALSLFETARDKITVRTKQMEALEKSVEYSIELLQNGFAIYPEVITARQSLLQAELGAVNDKLQQMQASVNLYRALGGGWQ